MAFSSPAETIRIIPNAGGSSKKSEVLSCELLNQLEEVQELRTEREIEYFPVGGSITDYVCTIAKEKVGVSVTRAMQCTNKPYIKNDVNNLLTEENAKIVLTKKLKGVKQSSNNSLENWNKQILFIWTPNKHNANIIVEAYNQLSEDIRSNTVVMVIRAKCPCIYK